MKTSLVPVKQQRSQRPSTRCWEFWQSSGRRPNHTIPLRSVARSMLLRSGLGGGPLHRDPSFLKDSCRSYTGLCVSTLVSAPEDDVYGSDNAEELLREAHGASMHRFSCQFRIASVHDSEHDEEHHSNILCLRSSTLKPLEINIHAVERQVLRYIQGSLVPAPIPQLEAGLRDLYAGRNQPFRDHSMLAFRLSLRDRDMSFASTIQARNLRASISFYHCYPHLFQRLKADVNDRSAPSDLEVQLPCVRLMGVSALGRAVVLSSLFLA